MADNYLEASAREIEAWPGVTFDHKVGGKHDVLTVHYRGQSRNVVFAKTPSDSARGLQNHIAQIRKELRAIGATKPRPVASPHKGRVRNKPTREAVIEKAAVRGNPFEVLAGITITTAPPVLNPPPAPVGLWQRLKAWWLA